MSTPVIVGHVTHDRYDDSIESGGCAYFGARVYKELGGRVRLVTAVGHDFEKHHDLEGFDVTMLQDGKTTTFANFYAPDAPRVQWLQALAPPISPDLCPAASDIEWLHLAPVAGELNLRDWIGAFPDAKIAINVQGWIKGPGPVVSGPVAEEKSGFRQVVQKLWDVDSKTLCQLDAAFVSEEDLIDQGDLLERLITSVPIVAHTLGSRGCEIYVQGSLVHRVGVYPARVVDPTGAGDVFAATFVQQVSAGSDVESAAFAATAASSVVIEHIGAKGLKFLRDEMKGRIEALRTLPEEK